LEKLIDKFNVISRKQKTLIIGIDGGGASGKSTLAQKLQMLTDDVTVVHMDDFYKTSAERELIDHTNEIGANWDWRRLEIQVLSQLKNDLPCHYQIYDWDRDKLDKWYSVLVGGIVIIEGCFSSESTSDFWKKTRALRYDNHSALVRMDKVNIKSLV
jgi:uridine kinase